MTPAALPTHERYKPSGFDWIGDMPSHWTLERLGAVLTAVSERNRPDLPLLSITREQGVIERDIEDQDSNHNFIPDDLSGYKVLREGQFGMNKMKAWQGSYGVSAHTGIVSPAYFIFDFTRGVDPEFFNIAIRSRLYVSYFGSASDGVRIGQWDLNQSRMRQIPVLLPPLSEQRSISKFLREKCAKVDRAVRIKEEQIALLRERRQILIQEAVTRGLNPNAPMKNSGIDWIGEIPTHWEVENPKWLFKHRKERARKGEQQLAATQKYGVIPQSDFMEMEGRRVTQVFLDFDILKHVEAGDFVMSMRSFQGGLEYSEHTGCVSSAYVALEPGPRIFAPYYKYLLKSARYIEALQSTSNLVRDGQALRFDNFAMVMLPVLPIEEQREIAEFLDSELLKSDAGISIKECQIAALKEYKTTLINAAVTGKIKVA